MSVTVCTINPPGHDWENGLTCRWCHATRTVTEAILSQLASRRGGDPASAQKLLDVYRAEVLAEAKIETVAWLVKKAGEGTPVEDLASKVDRGAVRAFLGTAHYRDALDAHRSQVLAEAAALLTARGYMIPADVVLQMAKRDPGSPAEAETTPDNDTVARRAHLARAIRQGGRWKSGTVVRWYEANGYTGCTVHTAREDLVALASAGVAVQHDEPGVRYYTAARQGGDRRG